MSAAAGVATTGSVAGGGPAGNSLSNQFAELNRLGEAGDYERALRVVNKSTDDHLCLRIL